MLDSLIKSIGPEVQSVLSEKFGLSPDQASKGVDTTKNSLRESVTQEAGSGNLDGLLDMVNSGNNAQNNSTFQKIAGKLAGDYTQKLNLPPDLATKISTYVLPLVLSKVTSMFGGNVDKKSLQDKVGGNLGGLLKGGLGGLFK